MKLFSIFFKLCSLWGLNLGGRIYLRVSKHTRWLLCLQNTQMAQLTSTTNETSDRDQRSLKLLSTSPTKNKTIVMTTPFPNEFLYGAGPEIFLRSCINYALVPPAAVKTCLWGGSLWFGDLILGRCFHWWPRETVEDLLVLDCSRSHDLKKKKPSVTPQRWDTHPHGRGLLWLICF